MKDSFAVIAGGGTAGHLHPGLAVANSLVEAGVDRESIIFLGSEREIDQRLVSAENFELIPLPGAGIQKRNPISIMRTLVLLVVATRSAIRIYQTRKPKIILALGRLCISARRSSWIINKSSSRTPRTECCSRPC